MSREPIFALLAIASVLLIVLIISFASRARVFSQYLELLTGIRITATEIKRVHADHGRRGVRELFLDLLIREDLAEGGVDSPEDPPSHPVILELDERRSQAVLLPKVGADDEPLDESGDLSTGDDDADAEREA